MVVEAGEPAAVAAVAAADSRRFGSNVQIPSFPPPSLIPTHSVIPAFAGMTEWAAGLTVCRNDSVGRGDRADPRVRGGIEISRSRSSRYARE